MALFVLSSHSVVWSQSTNSDAKLRAHQEAERARLEKYDKPLEKDVLSEVLTGGAVKGVITGSAAKAAAALATGAATKGGAEVAKEKVKAYKKARKVKISDEPAPPIDYGHTSKGKAQK